MSTGDKIADNARANSGKGACFVVIARGPMWWEGGGVARMRTADFVAAVRSR